VASVPLLLAGLEEPPVELFELDLEAVNVGVQLITREVVVALVNVVLDLEGGLDRLLFRHVG